MKYFLQRESDEVCLPIKSLVYDVRIINNLCEFTLTIDYENTQEEAINTVFVFPLETDMAVQKLQAKFGDLTIESVIDELESVKEKFRQGKEQGQTVVMGSYVSKQVDDLFRLELGIFPGNSKAQIVLRFYQILQVEDLGYRLLIPTKYFPRFGQTQFFESSEKNISQQQDLNISLQGGGPILRVQSRNHRIGFSQKENGFTGVNILDEDRFLLSQKDFVLIFSDESVGQPQALKSISDTGAQFFYLSFQPDFRAEDKREEVKEKVKGQKGVPISDNEVVFKPSDEEIAFKENEGSQEEKIFYFLIDRSGSMSGQRIEMAKEALQIFLRSLPLNSKFNIVSFGSSFSFLFKEPVQYNEANLNLSSSKVEQFKADMGGTEILGIVKQIYKQINQRLGENNFPQNQIFLLTDGQIADTQILIDFIKAQKMNFSAQNKKVKQSDLAQQQIKQKQVRFNCFGIGQGVSTQLVKGCAKAGNGMAYFIQRPDEIAEKIISCLSLNALPYLSIENIQFLDQDNKVVAEINEEMNSQLFQDRYKKANGNQNVQQYSFTVANGSIYQQTFFFENKNEIHKVQFNIYNPNLNKIQKIEIIPEIKNQFTQCVQFQTISEHLKYQYLDDKQKINLSVQYQVLCPLTAFFAETSLLDDAQKQRIINKRLENRIKSELNNDTFEQQLKNTTQNSQRSTSNLEKQIHLFSLKKKKSDPSKSNLKRSSAVIQKNEKLVQNQSCFRQEEDEKEENYQFEDLHNQFSQNKNLQAEQINTFSPQKRKNKQREEIEQIFKQNTNFNQKEKEENRAQQQPQLNQQILKKKEKKEMEYKKQLEVVKRPQTAFASKSIQLEQNNFGLQQQQQLQQIQVQGFKQQTQPDQFNKFQSNSLSSSNKPSQTSLQNINKKQVMLICSTQGTWDSQIMHYLRISDNEKLLEIIESFQISIKEDQTIFFTLLGIFYLRNYLDQFKTEWKLIEKKTIDYFTQQQKISIQTIQQILEQIKPFIQPTN